MRSIGLLKQGESNDRQRTTGTGGKTTGGAGMSKLKQRGYVVFPKGSIETMLVLAAIGFATCVVGACYGLYWLVTHVRFV